jgi:hypothetical protein
MGQAPSASPCVRADRAEYINLTRSSAADVIPGLYIIGRHSGPNAVPMIRSSTMRWLFE